MLKFIREETRRHPSIALGVALSASAAFGMGLHDLLAYLHLVAL